MLCAFLAGSFQKKKKPRQTLDNNAGEPLPFSLPSLGTAFCPWRTGTSNLFRYWEIIRSRIPPESEAIIATMRDSGQFNVIAGQIRDFVETEAALEVHYDPRGRTTDEVEKAILVINCIGPESN